METGEQQITSFVERLKKLGIEVELGSNFPWIYLYKVNGNQVNEKFQSDYGYTIAFLPIRDGQPFKFLDISDMFKVIRKYA